MTLSRPSSGKQRGGELRPRVLFVWRALPFFKRTPMFSFTVQCLGWINPNSDRCVELVNTGAVVGYACGFAWTGGHFLSASSREDATGKTDTRKVESGKGF
jgi:hypothetical protein